MTISSLGFLLLNVCFFLIQKVCFHFSKQQYWHETADRNRCNKINWNCVQFSVPELFSEPMHMGAVILEGFFQKDCFNCVFFFFFIPNHTSLNVTKYLWHLSLTKQLIITEKQSKNWFSTWPHFQSHGWKPFTTHSAMSQWLPRTGDSL